MTKSKETTSYEKALDAVEDFHSAPQILAQASKKIQDPNVEVNDIVNILKADPALTADIIRISNSAFYSFETEASNLSDAMSRIGFGEIIRLIGISMTKTLFAQDLTHYKIKQEEYWSTSICTALMMESLSSHADTNPNDAYTIGLLHSVGKIVLDEIMTTYKIKTQWNHIKSLAEWEKEVIGFTSAYAGAMILKRWGFPEKTCHPILYQLNRPKPGIKWGLHTSLYLSCQILNLSGNGFEHTDIDTSEIDPMLERLNVGKDQVEKFITQNRESFQAIKRSLDPS